MLVLHIFMYSPVMSNLTAFLCLFINNKHDGGPQSFRQQVHNTGAGHKWHHCIFHPFVTTYRKFEIIGCHYAICSLYHWILKWSHILAIRVEVSKNILLDVSWVSLFRYRNGIHFNRNGGLLVRVYARTHSNKSTASSNNTNIRTALEMAQNVHRISRNVRGQVISTTTKYLKRYSSWQSLARA